MKRPRIVMIKNGLLCTNTHMKDYFENLLAFIEDDNICVDKVSGRFS